MTQTPRISEAEWQVMKVLWDVHPASANGAAGFHGMVIWIWALDGFLLARAGICRSLVFWYQVRLTDIIEVHKRRANLRTGKWRIHSTGDFTTWFPYDGDRPKRNHVYRMFLSSQRVRIGFTVENEADAEAVFTREGLKLVEKPGT